MESIIKKYYLLEGSVLVNSQVGTKGVDCWFDKEGVIQHRCLSFEDFDYLEKYEDYMVSRFESQFC